MDCNGRATVAAELHPKPTTPGSSKPKKKPSLSRGGYEADDVISHLHGSDPVRVELSRLENDIREQTTNRGDGLSNSRGGRNSESVNDVPNYIGIPNVTIPDVQDLHIKDEFSSKDLLVYKVQTLAVKHHFEFNTKDSTPSLYVVQCAGEGCKWRLRASAIKGTKRFEANQCRTYLTPKRQELMKARLDKVKKFNVVKVSSDDKKFEVCDTGTLKNYIVNLDERSCECNKFKMDQFPCFHAVAAIKKAGKSPYNYCTPFYSTRAWKQAWSGSVFSLQEEDEVVYPDSILKRIIIAPTPKNQAGRPPNEKRKRSSGEPKRALHCSRCHRPGHNKASCSHIVGEDDEGNVCDDGNFGGTVDEDGNVV